MVCIVICRTVGGKRGRGRRCRWWLLPFQSFLQFKVEDLSEELASANGIVMFQYTIMFT